jgi:hypothetical protein
MAKDDFELQIKQLERQTKQQREAIKIKPAPSTLYVSLVAIAMICMSAFILYASIVNLASTYELGKIELCVSETKAQQCKYKAIYAKASEPTRYWLHFFEIPAIGILLLAIGLACLMHSLVRGLFGDHAEVSGRLLIAYKALLGIAWFSGLYWVVVFWFLRFTILFK